MLPRLVEGALASAAVPGVVAGDDDLADAVAGLDGHLLADGHRAGLDLKTEKRN